MSSVAGVPRSAEPRQPILIQDFAFLPFVRSTTSRKVHWKHRPRYSGTMRQNSENSIIRESHKHSSRVHMSVAAKFSPGHRFGACKAAVAVLAGTYRNSLQASYLASHIHRKQQRSSLHDTAKRDAKTDPRQPRAQQSQHTRMSPIDSLFSASPTDNVYEVPHRRALGPNSINSRADYLQTPGMLPLVPRNIYRSSDSLLRCRPTHCQTIDAP